MYGVLSYDQMHDIVRQRFEEIAWAYCYFPNLRGPVVKPSSVRMVGLLFARPESKLAKEEIIPGLYYFHIRSGNHIDFFCAGYGAQDLRDEDFTSQDKVGQAGWMFSPRRFNEIRKKVEAQCGWRYSGESDLILANAQYSPGGGVKIELDRSVKCYLDVSKRIGAINSVHEFFECIFRYAENAKEDDPTWGFSDSMGVATGWEGLLNVLLSLFPKNIGSELKKIGAFRVSS